MENQFEKELQNLLNRYPEVEDVSFTVKKKMKRDVHGLPVSPPVILDSIPGRKKDILSSPENDPLDYSKRMIEDANRLNLMNL